MKKKFRGFIAIMLCITCCPIIQETHAEGKPKDANPSLTLDFGDFSYTTSDIDSSSSRVVKVETDNQIKYEIYDIETEKLIDTYEVTFITPKTRSVNPSATTAYFTSNKKISGSTLDICTLRFTACVLYYSSGSFRSFEKVNYTTVVVADSISTMSLQNTGSSAWSHSGSFPCTQLDYSYTTNVVIQSGYSISAGELISAGFTINTNAYRVVNSSGSFKLYN